MYRASFIARFAAVVAVGVASVSAVQPTSTPTDRSEVATRENAQASVPRMHLAQFNPCPNRKCR